VANPGKLFCPSCGEEVEYFVMVSGGQELAHCSNCGLILQMEEQAKKKEQKIRPLQYVIAAEDSPLLLKTIGNMMLEKGIAKQVEACKNGEEFISKVTARLKENQPISLSILDVAMPILNGINAAVILRAIEKGFDKKRFTPILFFTSYKCDDTFKKVLKYAAPAKYINKGTGASPEQFAERLLQVIYQLLAEQ
jgi:CheY-like chemotaxis protein